MDSDIIGLILVELAIGLLHVLYVAARTGAAALGGQLSTMAKHHPELTYYQENKTKQRVQAAVEGVTYGMAAEIALVYFVWAKAQQRLGGCAWSTDRVLLVCAVLFVVGLVLVMGTQGIGRGIGRKMQDTVAIRLVDYVRMIQAVLLPAYLLVSAVDRTLGGKQQRTQKVTEEEIMQLVNAGNETGVIEEQQREMIHNIFAFDDRTVSEVMTHRKELVAVNVETEIAGVVDLARSERYSRMPVYQDSIDNVIGTLNTKDLLGLIGCTNITGFHVRDFMREALFVPETAKCDDVLSEMLRKKIQMGIVVDEYGGTAGAVCMEDILEEIVGNIQDEYDEEEQEVHRITDALYTIDGHADPEEVLPILGLPVPQEMEFDTMSGFVVDLLGRIPQAQENPSVQLEQVRFTVLAMEDNWVTKIKAEKLGGVLGGGLAAEPDTPI